MAAWHPPRWKGGGGEENEENLLGKKLRAKKAAAVRKTIVLTMAFFRGLFVLFVAWTKASAVNIFLFFLTDWERFWGIGLSERLA